MSRPFAPLLLTLAAAILAVSAVPASARPHHRTHRHAFMRGRQATAPLTAGSSSIRINSVGEVIGPNPDRSR